jgi:hypothetical protein
MKSQTMASLVAAAAFGAIMATASMASGEINRGGGPLGNTGRCPTRSEAQCMANCAPAGSTAEQVARCRTQCNYPDRLPPDPLDCQFLQRSQIVAPNTMPRGTLQRRQ